MGWGGLPQAFDLTHPEWKREAEELRQLLDPHEYAQARRSTQDAHYTSQEVIQGIYQGLERLGFTGPAHILEPSAGIGHFRGLMPPEFRGQPQVFTAVELDPLTAAIGARLYPGAAWLNRGFQEVEIPPGHFDLALGNVPFGSQKVHDPQYPELDFSIHNYFLAKSVASLREGGLAAFVVSRYFLDATVNPAREYLAQKADLLGAVRLPNTAFKRNALTEVTSDLVFFRRTDRPEPKPVWLQVGPIQDASGQTLTVNQYYLGHPGQMIGRMAKTHHMFREAADCLPPDDFAGFSEEIARRLGILPQGVYQPRAGLALELPDGSPDPNLELCAALKEDAFFVIGDGRLARRRPDSLAQPQYEIFEPRNRKAGERIAGLIKIRDSLTALMTLEQSTEAELGRLEEGRADLNRLYDAFVRQNGFINSPGNKQAFKDDPEYALLSGLEREFDPGLSAEAARKEGREPRPPRAVKADIFFRRVLAPRPRVERVETAKEALVVSMNEYGKPEMDFMSGLCGKSPEELTADLAGLIYLNPAGQAWELADHYLTGAVKAKLAEAEAAAQGDGRFKTNVEALKMVQPPDLEPVDIAVQLGSTWVPSEDMSEFIRHLLGAESLAECRYHPALGAWVLAFRAYQMDTIRNTVVWGTARFPGHRLLEAILNNGDLKVRDLVGEHPDGRPIYELNEAETAAASQKAEELRQKFLNWVWKDQGRRERLARLYNDRFNTHLPRKYNGRHLELPGASRQITLRPHQKDAIWRAVQDGTIMADHVVGAGKTIVFIGTVMEARRMGLLKKAMLVVPNHLLTQWRDAFYSLYPQANILVADKTDFKRENRERLFARMATGAWDAVIVAHSSFKKIGLPPAALEKVLNEQIDDLALAIEREKNKAGGRVLVKELEKARDRLQTMMKKKAETGAKDQALTFDQLGVDGLFVDEYHEFKNLFITTRMRNVAGLGDLSGSAKSFDLFVKCRWLQDRYQGRGVYLATGTPISNTIAEMFTLGRFLQYDSLKEKGLVHFDAWASTFGQVVAGWELDAAGVGYKLNSRFAKFQNMPELLNLYRTVGDVVVKSDLEARNQGRALVPKIKGGRPENLVVERSPLQAAYMGLQEQVLDGRGRPVLDGEGKPVLGWTPGSIIHRLENPPRDPRVDNPLKITNDARKAGLDYRLIDPSAPDFAGSKVNAAAGRIFEIWDKWRAERGTQLVFCDLSTPKGFKRSGSGPATDAASARPEDAGPAEPLSLSMDDLLAESAFFSVYDDLKAKLTAKGIPETEIRFIHEAQTDARKAKLFEAVNRGEVRVLLGSTAKMGAGMNVQRRLVALHHLDAPWRPSDLEQREGRILRQGNLFFELDPEGFEVEVIRYATKQTYDARMWQTIEAKAVAIEQFRRGDSLTRIIDDVAGEAANAAEMKAAATGNELIFMQVRLAADLKKMEAVLANFQRSQHQLERRIAELEKYPEQADREIASARREIAWRDQNSAKSNFFAAEGQVYGEKNRGDLLAVVGRAMKEVLARPERPRQVGLYRGFSVQVEAHGQGCQFVLEGKTGLHNPVNLLYRTGDEFSPAGFLQRLDNFLDRFEVRIEETEKEKIRQAEELVTARRSQGRVFPHLAELEALRRDNREVLAELRKFNHEPGYKSVWRPSGQTQAAGAKPPRGGAEAADPELQRPKPNRDLERRR